MNSSYLNDYFYSNPNTFNPSRMQTARESKKENNQSKVTSTLEWSADFKQLKQANDCSIEVSESLKVVKLKWSGMVDVQTTRRLLAAAINSIKQHGLNRLILDQSELIEFETEARLWIKAFLRTSSSKFSNEITHLASIRPKTISGNIFSNFASEILKETLPNLQLKRFESIAESIAWLNDSNR